jgi:hypothetical protein
MSDYPARLEPRACLARRFDLLCHLPAIFYADHSSSSLWKIADTG